MSKSHEIDCWKCGEQSTLKTRSEFDGCCWACGAEIDLEDYLARAMDERDQLRAEVERLTGIVGNQAARKFVCQDDQREVDELVALGIEQDKREIERLRAEVEVLRVLLIDARELIEHGDFREGHCMCGSAVDGHTFGDGHTPCDAGEYYAGQVRERIDAAMAAKEGE